MRMNTLRNDANDVRNCPKTVMRNEVLYCITLRR